MNENENENEKEAIEQLRKAEQWLLFTIDPNGDYKTHRTALYSGDPEVLIPALKAGIEMWERAMREQKETQT